MKIQNVQSQTNFNGVYFKKVSPEIQRAFLDSPAINKLAKDNDVFISQFSKKVKEPYGKILEYGYKLKVVAPPNLFSRKKQLMLKGISESALDLSKYNNKKEVKKAVIEDLLEQISYIQNFNDLLESLTARIK